MSIAPLEFTSPVLVLDPATCGRMIANRRESLAYRKDEVWEGIYHMSPDPTNEHQRLVNEFGFVFNLIVKPLGGQVMPGGNITDREVDWTFNFRCPDVTVMLPGCKVKDIESALVGGPDFLVEVLSPYDKSREKLDFYAQLGVREVLFVDPKQRELELFALAGDTLPSRGVASAQNGAELHSGVLPRCFSVNAEQEFVIRRTDATAGEWLI